MNVLLKMLLHSHFLRNSVPQNRPGEKLIRLNNLISQVKRQKLGLKVTEEELSQDL